MSDFASNKVIGGTQQEIMYAYDLILLVDTMAEQQEENLSLIKHDGESSKKKL